jgi:anti-sigma B factor antagonist
MPVTDFRITIESLGADVEQIKLSGDVDLRAAPELKQGLDGLVRDDARLLVDLSGAAFIDSTALGVMLGTVRRLRRRGGRLAVWCPNPEMRSLFAVVGHNLIFPVEETMERALLHLGARRQLDRAARFDRARGLSQQARSER